MEIMKTKIVIITDITNITNIKNKQNGNKTNEIAENLSKTPVLHSRPIEKNQVQIYKGFSPKIALRRNYLAENLKLKAEELAMKRIRNERRKNTEDYKLEKLILDKTENSNDSEEEKEGLDSTSSKRFTKHRKHKGSISKPLYGDDEQESPSRRMQNSSFYND